MLYRQWPHRGHASAIFAFFDEEQTAASLFFDLLWHLRSRIPAAEEHASLIISCKNSKNSGLLWGRTD
jgi:hypothetical protein